MLALLFACKFDEHFVTLCPCLFWFSLGLVLVPLCCLLCSSALYFEFPTCVSETATESSNLLPDLPRVESHLPSASSGFFLGIKKKKKYQYPTPHATQEAGARSRELRDQRLGRCSLPFPRPTQGDHRSPLWHQRQTVPGP